MRIDKLLSQRNYSRPIDYSKFTDSELDRIIEIFGGREDYNLLSEQEQQELDKLTEKVME